MTSNTATCEMENRISRSRTFPGVVLVFMPSLQSLFRAAEHKHGPLSHEQANQIRLEAAGTFVKESLALEMERSRGFKDLHPDDFWEEWQQLKAEGGSAVTQQVSFNCH